MVNFKQIRQENGISLEYVSSILKIRTYYLEAIENNCLEKLPGEAYVKGYTKMYVKFLENYYHHTH